MIQPRGGPHRSGLHRFGAHLSGADRSTCERNADRHLHWIAWLSALGYLATAWLSHRFDHDSPPIDRPLGSVLAILTCLFVGYLAAMTTVHRGTTKGSLRWIVAAGIVFRLIMLFSTPIQEVDLYRYLWDGAVSGEAISPFAHSPIEIRNAIDRDRLPSPSSPTDGPDIPDTVRRLVELTQREPSTREILYRVHFAELPTVYPLISQGVFLAVDRLSPANATVYQRVLWLKAVLVAFDLGTLFLVISLLANLRLPRQWCVAYAWCPLVIKEIANSGHLDAIAVFLTTAAVYLFVRGLAATDTVSSPNESRSRRPTSGTFFYPVASSVTLTLAVAAKIYPLALAPLLAIVGWRVMGWRRLIVPTLVFVLLTPLLLVPMVIASDQRSDPAIGLTTFLTRWEMNDFLFMLLIENARPTSGDDSADPPWFVITPPSWRSTIVENVHRATGIPPQTIPFFIARLITGGCTLAIAVWFACIASRREFSLPPTGSRPRLGHATIASAFFTLAWFWLLCPTQNPWYWTWSLPFLAVIRQRAWCWVSGWALIYYARFWFEIHHPATAIASTPYVGVAFYDFVVVVAVQGVWFLTLALSWLRQRRSNNSANAVASSGN